MAKGLEGIEPGTDHVMTKNISVLSGLFLHCDTNGYSQTSQMVTTVSFDWLVEV
jgi:hypothetical protein